jgi:hypothetical protein
VYIVAKIRAPKGIMQILTNMKIKIGNETMFIGKFITSLSTMDLSSRQKFNSEH